ncbi:MAG TPA: PAS domain S-box protein, partial [Bacteroidetes bacterium]|nr:PAS domain S-box protein [Bacteroidota bacterium]
LWKIPDELIRTKNDQKLIEYVLDQLQDPETFVKKVRELYQSKRKSMDTLYFKDGRIFKRFSAPLLQNGKVKGRVWSFRDVTRRNQMENELREREAFFSTIVENIPISLFIKDAGDLRFLRCNKAREELFGYSREEVIGKTNEDLFPPKLAEFLTQKDREVIASGGLVETAEERVSTRHKGERILHTQKIPLFDEMGEPKYLLCISEDITEQKQIEKALRESEEKFRRIVGVIHDVLYAVDSETREFSYLSPVFTKMFGYTEEDIQKMGGRSAFLTQVIQNDQFTNQKEKFDLLKVKVQKPEKTVRWESWWRCKDGRLLCIEDHSVPIYRDGRLAGTYGSLRNITERKAAEQEIRKLSQAVEQSPASIVVTDPDGNIEYVNPKFCRITGYSSEESIGQNPRILKSGEQSKEFYENLWQTITNGETWYGEFHNMKKNGDLFWEKAIIGPIKEDNGAISHFMAIKEDITERKQLEDQFRQAQKMEAIGTLAGGVAHDFNNLLTVINGYSQILLNDLKKDDPMYGDIREIYEAGERAAQLTQQLLAFSRKQLVAPEVLDLNDILYLLKKMLQRLLGEDIFLTITCDERPCIIHADRTQMEQVIMNLAVNARDAMPEGGQLTILTENILLAPEHGQTPLSLAAGEYILLMVSDTGEGMDEQTRAKIFEPFFTTKESGKGTGLGLAMVFGIAKQSGGEILVDSEPGKGTTFRVYLPRSEYEDQKVSVLKEDMALNGWETVLVVEDEDMVRELACRTLRRAGYRILAARNAGEAFMICEQTEKPVHLLLTDVVMPVINGRELAERLLQVKPGMKVLFMSGYTDDAIIRKGLLEEGLDLLHKPFAPPVLLKRVRAVLDGQKVLS